MKTLAVRKGDRLTIRAIAFPSASGERDRCATLAFFQEHAGLRGAEFERLAALLTETAENGPPQNEKKFKDLPGTDGLFEFKTFGGLRLLCFWDTDSLICTHGYLKDGQKAPRHEIERAEKLRAEYIEAKRTGTLSHANPK